MDPFLLAVQSFIRTIIFGFLTWLVTSWSARTFGHAAPPYHVCVIAYAVVSSLFESAKGRTR